VKCSRRTSHALSVESAIVFWVGRTLQIDLLSSHIQIIFKMEEKKKEEKKYIPLDEADINLFKAYGMGPYS
jgi:hypothetical protein